MDSRGAPSNLRLVARQGLSPDEHAAASALKAAADRHDRANHPFNLTLADSWASRDTRQLLAYAGDRLVGYLSADFWPDVEIYLAVDPARRRRGIGSALLGAAAADASRRGATSLTLVAVEGVEAGAAFVRARGGVYQTSEYRLELDPDAARAAPRPTTSLQLRPARRKDAAAIRRINARAFGGTGGQAGERFARELGSSDHRYYLGWLGDEPVGSIRVARYEDAVYLTSFGVLPEQQGKGHGREILAATIERVLAEFVGPIYIEVATDNRNALGLYRSRGFREIAAYQYYHLALR